MVRVGDFGSRVPKAVQDEVLARQKDIATGKLQPFAAGRTPILDNADHERVAAGQSLSDEQILKMGFLVQGVQGSVPR